LLSYAGLWSKAFSRSHLSLSLLKSFSPAPRPVISSEVETSLIIGLGQKARDSSTPLCSARNDKKMGFSTKPLSGNGALLLNELDYLSRGGKL
jgi:hypothetical protein